MNLVNNKYIDMHTYSIYSDGELEVDDLIKCAISNNVSILSITDHDTLLGVKKARQFYNKEIGIINGIELSAKVDKGRMHILGYDFDIDNKELSINNNIPKTSILLATNKGISLTFAAKKFLEYFYIKNRRIYYSCLKFSRYQKQTILF